LKIETHKGQKVLDKRVGYRELVTITNKEIVISAKKEPLEECGVLFSLDENRSFTYQFANAYVKQKRDFKVKKRGRKYIYSIQEILNPFKEYKIDVKGYKEINYRPQLSCKYRSKSEKREIESLYTKENSISLVPKTILRKSKKITLDLMESNSSKKNMDTTIPKELIPIYGDGVRFGLLSHGVSMDELTIDKEFSLKVANIFTQKIKPLLTSKRVQSKLKKNHEIIEGATVVIKIDEDVGGK